MPKRISLKKSAGLILLITTGFLTFMPNNGLKDLILSFSICLSLFISSHKGWNTTYNIHKTDGTVARTTSSGWSMLLSVVAALGLTVALTISPNAPKIYVFVATAPAFYATFNPVISRTFPTCCNSDVVTVLCTLALFFTVFTFPNTICGMGLLYISLVSQIVEIVVFDRFIAAVCVNLAVIVLELMAVSDGATDISSYVGATNVVRVGFIWKSLKDIAVVGTLFPILISFDLRKSHGKASHSGTKGYFLVAFAVFSFSLVAVTGGRILGYVIDLPLCLSTSTPVIVVVLLRSLIQRELGSLLMFNSKTSRSRSD